MANKAKHAFGKLENAQSALDSGRINEFDILFLDEDTDDPKVGWVTKNKEIVVCRDTDVSDLKADIATKADATEVEEVKNEMATKATTEEVEAMIETAIAEAAVVDVVEF